jgi:anti-sigma regulatory factor (Ser/Thr protein kinase)
VTSSGLREDSNIAPLAHRRTDEPSNAVLRLDAVDDAAQDQPPSAAVVEWQFPATPIHVRMARKWIEVWLSRLWSDGEAVANAAVVLSEVASNAVLHGIGPIRVVALVDEERLHCEVSDQSPQQPKARAAGGDDESGRGLRLAAALTIPGSFSVRRCPSGGKVVAFAIGTRTQQGDGRESERRPEHSAAAAVLDATAPGSHILSRRETANRDTPDMTVRQHVKGTCVSSPSELPRASAQKAAS